MKIDALLPPASLSDVPDLAQAAERIGFDAIWSTETQHDPFLPMALVAEHTQSMKFGTAVAIGFARSPGTLAYTSWDLAQASGGRFILGLGTQVRPHIERRFGMPWPESPVGKLREMILAVRALWATWQTDAKLDFHGDYFNLTLMTPFFNPGPIESPEVPIFIAGVNTGLCRLAGELADGFIAHPYHSERYLEEVVRSAIAEGARRAGRQTDEVKIYVSVLTVTEPDLMDFVRSQIAFYASTPSYRPVMALHGWGEVADRLLSLSKKRAWGEMPGLISDEMVETFALVVPPDQLSDALRARYAGLADRISLYLPYIPGHQDDFWRKLVRDFREA